MKLLKKLNEFLQFVCIIICALLMSILCACSNTSGEIKITPILEKYGEDCFHKPYINSRDNQSLCMTSAIAKHNAQVDTVNKMK